MKYAIVIPDGAADLPVEELDGRTPLEAARTPALDALASTGRVGRCATTPPAFGAGSDVCSMCLLGYDPATCHTGRAPLEAAALGIDAGPDDWIFRVNLVTTDERGRMIDHSAGGIGDDEAGELELALAGAWAERYPGIARALSLTHGVSYRSVLLDASGRDYTGVRTTPPHEIPGEPYAGAMPHDGAGSEAEVLTSLMQVSREVMADHPVNRRRRERGQREATMAWIWGGGKRPSLAPFAERFGLRGAMTTPVDLLAGIAALIGWDRLDVPGATSYHDNDYAGQGRAAAGALDDYDIVCCHVESPDEASHQGDWRTKVEAIEAIDRDVVRPIAEKLRTFGDAEADRAAEGWRLLVMPDHYTLVSTRKHDPTPVPFLIAGAWVRSAVERPFSEAGAADSDLRVDPGHELMEYFLRGGGASKR